MTQVRLNNLAVCHVHQGKLDNADQTEICQQFNQWTLICLFLSISDKHIYISFMFIYNVVLHLCISDVVDGQ